MVENRVPRLYKLRDGGPSTQANTQAAKRMVTSDEGAIGRDRWALSGAWPVLGRDLLAQGLCSGPCSLELQR